MAAPLDNPAVLQHHDHVGVFDSGQPVGDDEDRPPLHQLIHAALHNLLSPRVNGGGRLVEDHDGRVGDRRARDRDELPLALGEVFAVVGQQGIVSLRQAGDKVVRTRELGGVDALRVGGVKLSVADVFHDSAGKEVGILQDQSKGAAQV